MRAADCDVPSVASCVFCHVSDVTDNVPGPEAFYSKHAIETMFGIRAMRIKAHTRVDPQQLHDDSVGLGSLNVTD